MNERRINLSRTRVEAVDARTARSRTDRFFFVVSGMSHGQRHRPHGISLFILLFALTACDAQHGDGWTRRDDGSSPRLADIEDCHAEARRQAEARYPPQRVNHGGAEMTFENQDLFAAEQSFFEQCMHRKGFRAATR
jgi:hypothetical protein